MFRHASHTRPPSSLLLITLALLVLLAPPTSAGVMASLAALVFAAAAGFVAGQGDPVQRVAVASTQNSSAADYARISQRFDAVATLRLDGAVQRLRPPRHAA